MESTTAKLYNAEGKRYFRVIEANEDILIVLRSESVEQGCLWERLDKIIQQSTCRNVRVETRIVTEATIKRMVDNGRILHVI